MDENQLPTLISMLKGIFTGGQPKDQPTVYPASQPTQYPTSDDVNFARKNDYSYGQPWAPEFENKSARVLMGNPNASPLPATTFSTERLSQFPGGKDIADNTLKDLYAKAALASQNSALATLGFNPNRTAADVVRDPTKMNILGTYTPATDEIYTNAQTPSTLVHESIHRGIQKLRDSPLWDKSLSPDNEELLVRHLMQTKMGNPEKEHVGALGQRQQEAARSFYDPSQTFYAKTREENVRKLEEAAAQLIAQRRPGGPR